MASSFDPPVSSPKKCNKSKPKATNMNSSPLMTNPHGQESIIHHKSKRKFTIARMAIASAWIGLAAGDWSLWLCQEIRSAKEKEEEKAQAYGRELAV